MFVKKIINANENNYNVKITKSGTQLSMKSYSEIQTRKKVANPDKKYDVLGSECPDIFNTETGEIIDIVEFQALFESKEITKQQFFFTREKHIYHSLNYYQKKIRNKINSLKRSKDRIKNLINANCNNNKEHIKFLTLTFKENITAVKEANIIFKAFIRRFNKYLKIEKGYTENLKYISVLENQERGAIHYHIVLFNAPYIPFTDYMELWGVGSVYIESLMKNNKLVSINCEDGDFKVNGEKLDNVGAYITKTIDYVTKGFKDLEKNLDDLKSLSGENLQVLFTENAKIFQASKNLEKPTEVYLTVNEGFGTLLKFLKYFYGNKMNTSIYQNELFEMTTLNLNYEDDLEEINAFLEKLEDY